MQNHWEVPSKRRSGGGSGSTTYPVDDIHQARRDESVRDAFTAEMETMDRLSLIIHISIFVLGSETKRDESIVKPYIWRVSNKYNSFG